MVTRERPRLSLLVLTEDSASEAHETLVALAKKMLLLLDPACGTHLVGFEPQGDQARKVMHGNLWKSRRPLDRPKIVLLGRAIAAKILETELPGFALFHVDGDVPWSQHKESTNVARFDAFVHEYVIPALDHALRLQHKDRGEAPGDEQITAEAINALQRLIRLTPFYSIEAWLYQNIPMVRHLCTEHCGAHLDEISRWEADAGVLDELHQPKEQICLRGDHNRTLAESGFPAERVFQAGKSFSDSVERLLASNDLCAALTRTRPDLPSLSG
jgi:hypothetical protein